MPCRLATVVLAFLFAASLLPTANAATVPSAQVIKLRNEGLAQLENEQPGEAEKLFRQLAAMAPQDPLGPADLAVALLRQQKHPEALTAIAQALQRAPQMPQLLAIQADILQWSGKPGEALPLYRRAAAAAPDDVELQYSLYRQASSQEDGPAAAEALVRLVRLRPENLPVILQQGQAAIRAGDRAAATKAFLRVRELMWQAPPMAQPVLDQLLQALEGGDVAAARVPALRLENVLKVTPMYQQGLRELSSGIQGVPLSRLRDEPAADRFGEPLAVRFTGRRLDQPTPSGAALVAGDFDGDEQTDLAWLAGGDRPVIRLAPTRAGAADELAAAPGVARLLAADLDNDGNVDLIAYGPQALVAWRGTGGGAFASATDAFGLGGAGGSAAAVLDFDIEGDLDLALAGGASGGGELFRNALAGPLAPVGAKSLPRLALSGVSDLVASDLDRDGDLDLLVAHAGGLTWLDNQRQGRFRDRSLEAGLRTAAPARAVTSADLDNDGWPDLVSVGRGLALYHNRQGRFEPWPLAAALQITATLDAVLAFDADNDGRLDLAVAGAKGLMVLAQRPAGGFQLLPVDGGPPGAAALVAADLDRDGDLDLVAAGPAGLYRLDNAGGNRNHWLAVRLRGLTKGNSKNNLFGLGSTIEAWTGAAYQFREVSGEVTHLGLGSQPAADVLRVVWTNGVPQNRLGAQADQRVVEEQLLKGSCPFLYTWDGEKVAFVTDLLWSAPLGLPVAEGRWAGADPRELVLVTGAQPRAGVYDLRITEELWEAAFFDAVRLWVVDHPADVEVASSLRVLPGEQVPDRVLGSRDLRFLAGAWDAAGREVSERVRRRDEIYADGWRPSPYQGVAAAPWVFTLDLGAAPGEPIRLLLDGWIFPADASLNLAVAQRRDLAATPPRLEVEVDGDWQVLMPAMGFPAGKTKTMVVDTPPLPAGAHRLRIVSGQWLSWDRIAWTLSSADDQPRVVARLAPAVAELGFRGFSELVRRAPNAPHSYDYARTSQHSPWLPFPGRYTRYGGVGELLAAADDRSVILGPGDEIRLAFDAGALPPPPVGWRRSVLLESEGWDKDADRNTYEAQQVEPLPFRAMSGYPYGPDESFPDTPLLRAYVEEWLTRVVAPPPTVERPAP